MKTYQLVFSPTGGTEKAAAAITKNWPQVRTIDLSLPDTDYSSISIEPDALVLVAMPCFGGVAPQLALDRFARIKGNGATCVLVAVYGNRAYENTLVQMQDTAQTAGFRVIAAVSAVAEHSIITSMLPVAQMQKIVKNSPALAQRFWKRQPPIPRKNRKFPANAHIKRPAAVWCPLPMPAVPGAACAHKSARHRRFRLNIARPPKNPSASAVCDAFRFVRSTPAASTI